MDTLSNLPPELQEVEIELRAIVGRRDMEAGRALIGRLAAEAQFGKVLADEADLAALEIQDDIDTFPEIEESAQPSIDALTRTSLAGTMTAARYLYAAMRWVEIEPTLP